jgi:FtsP/CotA-like multicopper oxidase with cupredoxin domain
MLTMADMGMMMDMDMDGTMKHHSHMDKIKGDTDMQPYMPDHGSQRRKLPTQDLPDRIRHGPAEHGPASITMARTAYRRLDYPGAGLGSDGWRVLTYSRLRALERPYGRRAPTRQFDLHLTGNMHKYIWGFDGKKWSQSDMIRFQYGERLRINMINDTMMSHPIHLHGMWMDLYAGGTLDDNPRKHTVIVQPAELLTVDILADAPGQWAFHCHLLYHMEAGMFRTVAVVKDLEGGAIHAHV